MMYNESMNKCTSVDRGQSKFKQFLKDIMTIFRSRGFDTLIGKGTTIRGELVVAANSTAVIDGTAELSSVENGLVMDKPDSAVAHKTTLMVNGTLRGPRRASSNIQGVEEPLFISVHNVIITGNVTCASISVEGTLAIKSGAVLKAKKILYRELIIETGAVVHGEMFHLDHTSEGEQT